MPPTADPTLLLVIRRAERHRPWGTRWCVFSPTPPTESRHQGDFFTEEGMACLVGLVLAGFFCWVFGQALCAMGVIDATHTPSELTAAQNWMLGGVFLVSFILGLGLPFSLLGLGRRADRQGLLNTAETRRVNELLEHHLVLVAPVARWVGQSLLTVGDLEEIESLVLTLDSAAEAQKRAAVALAARHEIDTILHEGPLGAELERNRLEETLGSADHPRPVARL